MPALPSVLLRISTGEILARANYPREDMGPVQGLDPDLEWMVVREPFPIPNYDPRFYALVTTEQRGPDPDATFAHLHPWLVTYTTQKRPKPDIIVSAENKERTELDRHVRTVEFQKLAMLGLAILFREVQGLQLTGRENTIKAGILSTAVKLRANDDHLQEIITQINANQEPDLDSGWSAP